MAARTDELTLKGAEYVLLRSYVEKAIVPIFLMHDGDSVEARGTGTLLEVGERLFIITASHIFDDCEPTRLASPWGRKLAATTTWGEFRLIKAPARSNLPDVAIAELQSATTIEAFRATYRILTLDQIAMPSAGAMHILAGFPAETTTLSGAEINSNPFIYYTTMLAEPPPAHELADPLQPSLDLFFPLGREGKVIGIDGPMIEIPNLRGTSGCVIWEVVPSTGLWTQEKVLKAVGIQRSAMTAKWFRATNWLSVIPMLAMIDEDAAFRLAVALKGEKEAIRIFEKAGLHVA